MMHCVVVSKDFCDVREQLRHDQEVVVQQQLSHSLPHCVVVCLHRRSAPPCPHRVPVRAVQRQDSHPMTHRVAVSKDFCDVRECLHRDQEVAVQQRLSH